MSPGGAREGEVEGLLVDVWRFPVTLTVCLAAVSLSLLGWSSPGFDPFLLDGRAFRGEPWRVLSAHFVHGDPFHLLFNLYWTWTFGRLLEPRLGRRGLVALIVYIALGVSLACHAFDQGGIGLSGLGYGLWAFLALGGGRVASLRGLLDRRTNFLFAAWFLVCLAMTLSGRWNISNEGHAAGALLGASATLAIGFELRSRPVSWALPIGILLALLACATLLRERVNLGDGARIDAYTGYQALEREDWPSAHELLSSSIRIDPSFGDSWANLAYVLRRMGKGSEAAELALRASELGMRDKRSLEWILHALDADGHAALARQDWQTALTRFESAVKVDPSSMKGWAKVAYVHEQLGDRKASADAAFRAYELGERESKSVDWLIHALATTTAVEDQAGRHDSALDYARRAVQVAPDSAPLWENVRLMAERAGDAEWVDRARSELTRLPPLPK